MNDKRIFLMPYSPKLDKIAALYILLTYVVKQRLEDVRIVFHQVGETLPETFIDVDAVSDYKSAGYKSATQRVLDESQYASLQLRSITGMDHFAACFDLNNRTGELKNRFPNNFFNLVNDWPRVTHNTSRDGHLTQLIETMFEVFDCYFQAATKSIQDVELLRNPFCRDGVRKIDTIITGFPDATGLAPYLQHMLDRTSQADKVTYERAKAIKPEFEFELPTAGDATVMGAVFRTDDRRLIRYLFDLHSNVNVFILRHRDGHMVIMSRGHQDFGAMAQVLSECEPGRWHHETRYRSPFLANGGESRSVEPTSLMPCQIRDLLLEHFVYTSRSQAAAV